MLPRSSSQADLAMLFCISSVPGTQNFSGGASGKELSCHCRLDVKRHWFDLCVGKIPWRKTWEPTSVFLPENPMDIEGYSIWGRTELDITEMT